MTKIKNSLVFILLIVVFTACKVSQDIATPVPELPANFRNAATAIPTALQYKMEKFLY
jgi:type III secretory pathway lipoprotein EscJ